MDERLLAYRRMGESSSRLLKEKARLHDTINKTLALSSASDSDYDPEDFSQIGSGIINYIINPFTNKKVNLLSTEAKKLLKQYVYNFLSK